uniref:Uncharacterized protein n=1 Tax=Arundo donax TaxID=35708 RepID=A0A0A9BPS8_ARUDO
MWYQRQCQRTRSHRSFLSSKKRLLTDTCLWSQTVNVPHIPVSH